MARFHVGGRYPPQNVVRGRRTAYRRRQVFGHLHHEYAPDRLYEPGIATAQQAADAWETQSQQATQKWATNLQQTNKPIVSAAVAQKGVAVQRYTDALTSGRWERALQDVGDAGIKAAAAAKAGNYGTGISTSKAKYQAKIGPLLSYIAAGLGQLEGMPSGTTAAGVARATYWIQYMAGAKGL